MFHRLVLQDTLRRDPRPNQGETDSRFLPGEGEEKSLHWRFLAAQGLSHCHAGSTQRAGDPRLPLVGASRGQWEVWCLRGASGSK